MKLCQFGVRVWMACTAWSFKVSWPGALWQEARANNLHHIQFPPQRAFVINTGPPHTSTLPLPTCMLQTRAAPLIPVLRVLHTTSAPFPFRLEWQKYLDYWMSAKKPKLNKIIRRQWTKKRETKKLKRKKVYSSLRFGVWSCVQNTQSRTFLKGLIIN